jgi:cephalosporin hydroxylase
MTPEEKGIVEAFHRLYYDGPEGEGRVHHRTRWMGVPCLKCPMDLWAYQEILAEVRPDLVIETGTHRGGSALFLAHMLDLLGRGEVFTIDVLAHSGRPEHPRIRYVTGSSADEGLVRSLLDGRPAEKRLVILDSDHTRAHVARELTLFSPYVSAGSYLVVEDTNVNGHPVLPDFGEGPFEAVEEFLAGHPDFASDSSREKFLMTFNPKGFLRRVGGESRCGSAGPSGSPGSRSSPARP